MDRFYAAQNAWRKGTYFEPRQKIQSDTFAKAVAQRQREQMQLEALADENIQLKEQVRELCETLTKTSNMAIQFSKSRSNAAARGSASGPDCI